MAEDHRRPLEEMARGLLLDDPDFLREIVQRVLQELLEAEMTEHVVGAAPYERASNRKEGHRNAHKPRTLPTRVGAPNPLVPRDREGTFSTRLFSRYRRNEKAPVLALMEVYVEEEGVPTRKLKDITEELCGTRFSKSTTISRSAAGLDAELSAWRSRPLEAESYPYVFVADARYEKARVDGRVASQGVLVVPGVRKPGGLREILGVVEVAATESEATSSTTSCSAPSKGEGSRGWRAGGLRRA